MSFSLEALKAWKPLDEKSVPELSKSGQILDAASRIVNNYSVYFKNNAAHSQSPFNLDQAEPVKKGLEELGFKVIKKEDFDDGSSIYEMPGWLDGVWLKIDPAVKPALGTWKDVKPVRF